MTHESTNGCPGGLSRVTRRIVMEALALTALASPSIAASQDAAAIPPISEEVADYSAMLKRAEYCIECLRTRYICDGCKVHEEGAERVLRYFRSQAAGEPDNAEEWQAIIDFFCSHGQSLDWILSGDPCGLICTVASHSPAATGQSHVNDPIFAAIEDHKRAYDALSDCLKRKGNLQDELPKNLRLTSIDAWESKVGETDDPRWIAIEQEAIRLHEAEDEAAIALMPERAFRLHGVAPSRRAASLRAGRPEAKGLFYCEKAGRPRY
jgi:hypothetical protein